MFKSFFISILFEKRLTIITMFLFTAAIGNGQREQKNYLSPQQLAELHNELHINIENTTRIRLLLRMAKYHFENGQNDKHFLDSAAQYIRNVKEINAKHPPGKAGPLVLLNEASLTRRSGDFDSGQLRTKRLDKRDITLILNT